MNNKLKKIKGSTRRGFTFLEVIVATFIFVIAMVMIAQIFSSGYLGFRKARALQQDLEAAQQAINIMAKTLRTSAVISPDADGSSKSIVVFDYSRSVNNCIKYEFPAEGAGLKIGSVTKDNPETCRDEQPGAGQNMTSGKVFGNFHIVPNDPDGPPKETGRLTISMKVCLKEGCSGNPKNEARVQTTVSLRNYKEVR